MTEPLIYDLGAPGRQGVIMPDPDVPTTAFPADLLRTDLDLPEVDQSTVVRHFTRLSKMNYSIDQGLYPLGSGSMKSNQRPQEANRGLPRSRQHQCGRSPHVRVAGGRPREH